MLHTLYLIHKNALWIFWVYLFLKTDIIEASAKMVQNIIAIGKNFDMHILAEGVETKEQKEILTTFGCDRFQGYYFSKPLPKEELLRFLKEQTFPNKS